MARRRTKSVQDILAQGRRLQFELGNPIYPTDTALSRMDRIDAIRARYIRNIERSQRWQNERDRAYNQRLVMDRLLAINRPYDAGEFARNAGQAAANAVQIPRNIYMGLNNG